MGEGREGKREGKGGEKRGEQGRGGEEQKKVMGGEGSGGECTSVDGRGSWIVNNGFQQSWCLCLHYAY